MAQGFNPTGAVGGGIGEAFIPDQGLYPGPVRKVAILGHSFVRYLPVTREIYRPFFQFTALACPGATVESLPLTQEWSRLSVLKPSLTFIIIGGNDIKPGIEPKDLAHKIEDLAQRVKEITGGEVKIFGIEKRVGPRGLTADRFNQLRNAVNRWLKRHIIFTRDRYLSMDTNHTSFARDGVHLNIPASDALFKKIHDVSVEFFASDEQALNDRWYELFCAAGWMNPDQ